MRDFTVAGSRRAGARSFGKTSFASSTNFLFHHLSTPIQRHLQEPDGSDDTLDNGLQLGCEAFAESFSAGSYEYVKSCV